MVTATTVTATRLTAMTATAMPVTATAVTAMAVTATAVTDLPRWSRQARQAFSWHDTAKSCSIKLCQQKYSLS